MLFSVSIDEVIVYFIDILFQTITSPWYTPIHKNFTFGDFVLAILVMDIVISFVYSRIIRDH